MPSHHTVRHIPTACVSYTCPAREKCELRQRSFSELKAAHAAGLLRNCSQPGEVCPRSLHRALHSMSGASWRWEKRKASGLSDTDLADAIGYEFGEWHQGCDGVGYTAMRHPPRIWFGWEVDESGKRRTPDLQGKALLAAVRELLGIPLPVVAAAPAPWAGLPLMAMMTGRN